MQEEDEKSRILRSSNWTRENQDKRKKCEECIRLANSKWNSRCTEVFKIVKLLWTVY